MVLAELGQKIGQALTRMSAKAMVGDDDVKELLNEIAQALLQADVNIALVKKLQDSVKTEFAIAKEGMGINKRKVLQNAVFHGIQKMLDPGVKPYYPVKGKANVVMFVGLQGAGKTTSCTKYGAYYARKGFKVALVCADTFRAGAFDQLRQNAAKAKLHFYGSLTETDPAAIASEAVAELKRDKYDLIIIDTSGRHKQETALFDEMKQIERAVQPHDIVFVMSATDGQGVEEQARHFRAAVPVGSVIVTKLDCHAKGGGALSAVAATRSPIVFIGTGEHSTDFDLFQPDRFVQKMLGMGDLSGLLDTMKDANLDANSEVYKRIHDGQFTLRDFLEIMQSWQKVGSLSKMLEMLPGMSGLAEVAGERSDLAARSYLRMMDSMTSAELDEDKVKKMMTPARIHRIARGSGYSIVEVYALIKMYSKLEEIIKKLGKNNFKALLGDAGGAGAGLGGGGGGGGSLATSRAGQQQMAQLSKLVNPAVLKQMGGMGGLQNMMRQLQGAAGGGGGGGMPDMSAMMQMMRGMQRGGR